MGDKPQGFAIMRNGHEAFRSCLKALEKLLDGPAEGRVDFLRIWADFLSSMNTHMEMEDHDLFKVLDETSGGEVTKGGLFGLHGPNEDALHALQKSLPSASESDADWSAFSDEWKKWVKGNDDHFQAEEKLMMPLTMKTAPTAEERAFIVHYRVIQPALKRNAADFHFHMCFCVEYLSKYGSSQQNASTATAVYVRGLKSACTKELWTQFLPLLKGVCVPEVWNELNEKFHLDSLEEGLLVMTVTPPAVCNLPTPAPAPAPAPVHAPASPAEPAKTTGAHPAEQQASPKPKPQPKVHEDPVYYNNSGCNCIIM